MRRDRKRAQIAEAHNPDVVGRQVRQQLFTFTKRDTPLTLELTPECKLRNMGSSSGGLLQIGDVAAQTGLSVDAIRFCERERLLLHAARSNGGFRLFSKSDVEDLAFIRNAQELGFSLQEIRELITLKRTAHPDCKQVEKYLEQKTAVVREKIAALRKLERELRRAMANCESHLRHGRSENCPVLAEISQTKGSMGK
jgi:DNA-binding transcriptional MerR regulator